MFEFGILDLGAEFLLVADFSLRRLRERSHETHEIYQTAHRLEDGDTGVSVSKTKGRPGSWE